MSRFIRSALFPILIVIIVAMFIEWVISGNKANETPKAIYAAPFVTQQAVLQSDLQNGAVKTVIFDTGDASTAKVTTTSGLQYYVKRHHRRRRSRRRRSRPRTSWSRCPRAR